MTPFCDDAWDATADLYRRTIDLPFNRELAAGTLAKERFRFYVIQDALYLRQYSRALSAAAVKAPDSDAMEQFNSSAHGAIAVERTLHGGFLEQFGVAPDDAAQAEPSPTCYGYTNFMLTLAHTASYEELVAAILPCFWIYWRVGNHIANEVGADNPYQPWIDTYSDPAFGEATQAVKAITDRAAEAAPTKRPAMLAAFRRSAQFEWMFWDSAYRLEHWPVAV